MPNIIVLVFVFYTVLIFSFIDYALRILGCKGSVELCGIIGEIIHNKPACTGVERNFR